MISFNLINLIEFLFIYLLKKKKQQQQQQKHTQKKDINNLILDTTLHLSSTKNFPLKGYVLFVLKLNFFEVGM